MAAISPGYRQEAILFLEKLHNEIGQGDFEYTFVSDEIEELYNKDKQVAIIYSVFALIAILISSLGLFGLSLFDVQQRYREIAIRKVNGATASSIVRLIARDLQWITLAALVAGFAGAYLIGGNWLLRFATKTPLNIGLFAGCGLTVCAIIAVTVILKTRRTACENPVKSIKKE